MAKEYHNKLSSLIKKLDIEKDIKKTIEVKHLFSGAALYVNKNICVTWSPVGLAFKLSEDEVNKLLSSGKALPLKYFPKGHVKKDYALFEKPEDRDPGRWRKYFIKSASLV